MAITTEMRTSVLELYTAYFNRAADTDGVNYWLGEMDTKGWSIDDVANSFAQQTEYINLYSELSNTQIVSQVYTNVLNRTADSVGAEYWEGELANGNIGVSQLVQAVINAATEIVDGVAVHNIDATIVTNKSSISQYTYDNKLNKTNISLSNITSDITTVNISISTIDSIVDSALDANVNDDVVDDDDDDDTVATEPYTVEVDTNDDGITDQIKYYNVESEIIKMEIDNDFNGILEQTNTYVHLEDGNIEQHYDLDSDGINEGMILRTPEWIRLDKYQDRNGDGIYDKHQVYDGTSSENIHVIIETRDDDYDGSNDMYKEYTYLENGNTIVESDSNLYGSDINGLFEYKATYETIEGSHKINSYYSENDDGIYDAYREYEYLDDGSTIRLVDNGITGEFDQRDTFSSGDKIEDRIHSYYDWNGDGRYEAYKEYTDDASVQIRVNDYDYDGIADVTLLRTYLDNGNVLDFRDYDFDGIAEKKTLQDENWNMIEEYYDSNSDGTYNQYNTYDSEGNFVASEEGDFGEVELIAIIDVSTLLIS